MIKWISYLVLILSILIQGSCFFKAYKDSEVILKSETLKEEEKFEERITFIIAYSLNKEHLLISISSYKATHRQIIALIKEKYKDSKKIRLNDHDIREESQKLAKQLTVMKTFRDFYMEQKVKRKIPSMI